ncbi:hypothetical protein APR04_005368 [Promicromonospora umidemergens]|uniref:Zinc finger protein n=1 Tax=Promicromonospora umidemergens TaxID=629679 RepID=A0ABP8XT36_9MICO|nr:hypothetical protein [Promicromonospora umidemergens]MCP2286431.1 hypothetical protein [Promicromonospora umidemergens]
MTVTSADLSQWAAHRRAVVFTVSRRVHGIDPELAASRGLELLCVELLKQGEVSDPVAFWTTAAVDVALAMAHEEPMPDDQAASEAITAPIRRALDFEVLTAAMERLSAGDQQLLWDHHVGSRPVAAIADEIGVLPYAAKRRLRRAENRLASSFAETHTGTADDIECESTRASMHDFVRNRLLPGRRQKVEDHMVLCAGCTRAFVDVRESYWMLRAAAPVLLLGAVTAVKASTAVGTAGVAATGAGLGGGIAALGTRVALTVRSALTDPISLTATVAGGLFLTSAVTTGVAGVAGVPPTFFETGVVSVSTPGGAKAVVPDGVPTAPAEEPADRPESTRFVPPGLAKGTGMPPGLAKQDGVPPGLAKQNDVPPGQAKQDGAPADQADDASSSPRPTEPSTGTSPGNNGTDRTPPGLAKTDGTPPGQAKKNGTPPGQAKKNGTPPGQSGEAARPDRSDEAATRSNPGRGNA